MHFISAIKGCGAVHMHNICGIWHIKYNVVNVNNNKNNKSDDDWLCV